MNRAGIKKRASNITSNATNDTGDLLSKASPLEAILPFVYIIQLSSFCFYYFRIVYFTVIVLTMIVGRCCYYLRNKNSNSNVSAEVLCTNILKSVYYNRNPIISFFLFQNGETEVNCD